MRFHHHYPICLFLSIVLISFTGCKKKDMSLKMNEPRNIKGVISYKRSFGDLNDIHLKAAQSLGIRPLASREEAERMKEKLVQIRNNEHYSVDSLTHSIPFLIPRAGALLDTIGVNFLDSLTSKGLNPNQIVVTSVLRTEDDVKTFTTQKCKCIEKLRPLLWNDFRCKLETFQKNRGRRRASVTRCIC